MSKWIAEHGIGELVREKTLLRVTKARKLWRASTDHILKGSSDLALTSQWREKPHIFLIAIIRRIKFIVLIQILMSIYKPFNTQICLTDEKSQYFLSFCNIFASYHHKGQCIKADALKRCTSSMN